LEKKKGKGEKKENFRGKIALNYGKRILYGKKKAKRKVLEGKERRGGV